MARNVPLRKSLLARLLVTSMLIAVCSIVATAWLAVQTTTRAIRQEQGQILSDDAMIHDTLTGYAAGHKAWDGVQPTIERLARATGRRVALTDQNRHVLADSAPKTLQLPPRAFAVIDALRTDTPLQGQNVTTAPTVSRIDPRAVGPYRLPAAEHAFLARFADKVMTCLREEGWAGKVADTPSGRPTVQVSREGLTTRDAYVYDDCGLTELSRPTATERRALTGLDTLVNACLSRQGSAVAGYVNLSSDFTWAKGFKEQSDYQVLQDCIDASRREQLSTFVAPAAQLFVSDTGASPPRFDLSRSNTTRIAGVTGLVLLLTVMVTALIATRLVRPLRALTKAAQEPIERHTRVPVTTSDETGFLAAAFNDLSERRERTETQRKAMVSDIAHELRTPLTNIRGWLEVAKDGIVVPDQRLLSSLHDEALLLQHIIDDLQDLASADAGTLRLHPEPVRLPDLLDQVVDANLAHAKVAGVSITGSVEGDPHLSADPVRLRQAIGNLVSNALRHTPSGGSVTLHAYESDGMVTIDVADTGSGISAEDLANIFDRFWRAEKSRSRRTGGSGLGLAIVRQLAQAHGGTVTARSVPGRSTVFTLRLPPHPVTDGPEADGPGGVAAEGPGSAGRVPGDSAVPRARFGRGRAGRGDRRGDSGR